MSERVVENLQPHHWAALKNTKNIQMRHVFAAACGVDPHVKSKQPWTITLSDANRWRLFNPGAPPSPERRRRDPVTGVPGPRRLVPVRPGGLRRRCAATAADHDHLEHHRGPLRHGAGHTDQPLSGDVGAPGSNNRQRSASDSMTVHGCLDGAWGSIPQAAANTCRICMLFVFLSAAQWWGCRCSTTR